MAAALLRKTPWHGNIEHHIEEEEGDMFRTARSVLDRQQLESIGLRMEALEAERRKPRR